MTANEWQPIETAPRDGTDILVCCGPDFDPMFGVAAWRNDTDGWFIWWDTSGKIVTWPEFWMPLPLPPESPA